MRTPLELRSLGRCLKGVSVLSADSQTQAVGPRSPHSTARGPARPRRGLPAVPSGASGGPHVEPQAVPWLLLILRTVVTIWLCE